MRSALLHLIAATITIAGCASADLPRPGESVDRIIRVGPSRDLKTLREALRIAPDGATIEIDAATYRGDVGAIRGRNLTIRGVGGRPRFDANGHAEEGKGILVMKGDNVRIENLELANARVIDRNGAGIRHETGRLVLHNMRFVDNENGILTGNAESLTLEVHDSEFSGNGHGDGFSHQIYAGTIGRLLVRGSYISRGKVGHLIKSRARTSFILYNRLTDESGGTASYEIDLPSGGIAYLIGNLIQQSDTTENSTLVAFGAEKIGRWPENELIVSHNTLVNHRREGCVFIHTRPPSHARILNNIFVGSGCQSTFAGTVEERNNVHRSDERVFASPAAFDFRLRSDAADLPAAVAGGEVRGFALTPAAEYRHPAGSRPLPDGLRLRPGAFQTSP